VQLKLVILTGKLDIQFDPCYIGRDEEGPMSNVRLGNHLKVARAEKNLSQEELARLVDVTRQTISSIETGQYGPSAALAFLLSRRLGKRVDELFFLEGDDS
jgi:putative transcriptional regulator